MPGLAGQCTGRATGLQGEVGGGAVDVVLGGVRVEAYGLRVVGERVSEALLLEGLQSTARAQARDVANEQGNKSVRLVTERLLRASTARKKTQSKKKRPNGEQARRTRFVLRKIEALEGAARSATALPLLRSWAAISATSGAACARGAVGTAAAGAAGAADVAAAAGATAGEGAGVAGGAGAVGAGAAGVGAGAVGRAGASSTGTGLRGERAAGARGGGALIIGMKAPVGCGGVIKCGWGGEKASGGAPRTLVGADMGAVAGRGMERGADAASD